MSKSGANAEPSMEEILASIRQIISDDEPQEEAGETAQASEPAAEAELETDSADGEDISEADLDALFADPAPAETDEAQPDPMAEVDGEMEIDFAEAEPEVEPEPEVEASAPEEEDVLDLSSLPEIAADEPFDPPSDLGFDEVPAEPEPEPEPVMEVEEPEPVAAAPERASLLSREADSAVSSAFADLASTMLSGNARTLEDLVQDMLRPMLKSWLDENLPTMVEKMVREEIERVARRGPRS
jgi:hypothetical protein